MAERLINGEVERADEFDNVPVGTGGEAFFKFVDAVEVAVFGETGDAVEVVSLEFMFGGVLDHMPLDGVLGVVFLHVPFVAAAEEVYNLGAVEHEHGGREGHRSATRHAFFRTDYLAFDVIRWASGKVCPTGSFLGAVRNIRLRAR